MPKLKTKSGAKKRFKITGTGKVLVASPEGSNGCRNELILVKRHWNQTAADIEVICYE